MPSLQVGSLGVVPEYSGALLEYLRPRFGSPSAASLSRPETIAAVQRALPEELAVGASARAQNRDVLVMRREQARAHEVRTVRELASVCRKLVFGGPKTFVDRQQGLRGMGQRYGCRFAAVRGYVTDDAGVLADLMAGSIDVARWTETSPLLTDSRLRVLEDDQGLFASQEILPLYRRDSLTTSQVRALDDVSKRITTRDLRRILPEVDAGTPVDDVATKWWRALT